jgi:hypothetical protein
MDSDIPNFTQTGEFDANLLHIGAWCVSEAGPYPSNIPESFRATSTTGNAAENIITRNPSGVKMKGPEFIQAPREAPLCTTYKLQTPAGIGALRTNKLHRSLHDRDPIQRWAAETAREQQWHAVEEIRQTISLENRREPTAKRIQKPSESERAYVGSSEAVSQS